MFLSRGSTHTRYCVTFGSRLRESASELVRSQSGIRSLIPAGRGLSKAPIIGNPPSALPENVNYAVKSSFLLGFLESVPDVAAKLKEPNTKDTKFDDVVEKARKAAALVVVY